MWEAQANIATTCVWDMGSARAGMSLLTEPIQANIPQTL